MTRKQLFEVIAGLRDDFTQLRNKLTLTETNHGLAIEQRDSALEEVSKLREKTSGFLVLKGQNEHLEASERSFRIEVENLKGKVADHLADNARLARDLEDLKRDRVPTPIPMILLCPQCGERHIDEGRFACDPHHTHACQACGFTWRPAVVATIGVRFLPGFKNASMPPYNHVRGDGPLTPCPTCRTWVE